MNRLCRIVAASGSADTSSAVRSMGLIGAGVMGTAIATLNLSHRIRVLLFDADREAMAIAKDRIIAELRAAGQDEYEKLLVLPESPAALAECDLVLESVVEIPAVKQQVYAQFEPYLGADAILGTNTSTIPIARLTGGLMRPARFCGVHFFHPAGKRSLVEIIRGPHTTDATATAAVTYARQLNKTPIVSADSPGFVVNRMTSAYVGEALELLAAGVPIEQLESAATAFGMAMGPVRMLDEIGLDTVLRAGAIMSAAYPDRAVRSPILVQLVKARQLGCKTGAGFFVHPAEASLAINPRALEIIARWVEPQPPLSQDEILVRLLLPMLLEAARMIEERVVQSPDDIDLGVIFGLGFPARQGGLLYWADGLGPTKLSALLQRLAPLGARMHAPAILESMLQSGRRFADLDAHSLEGIRRPLPYSQQRV